MNRSYLMRSDAPLTEPEWAALDERVLAVARRLVVGRRFLPLWGPLGPGFEVVPVQRVEGWDAGAVDMTGASDDPVTVAERIYLKLPLLHKDFVLVWRDMEQSQRVGVPLDFGVAEAAAAFVAQAEDHLVFHGFAPDRVPGLLTVPGHHELKAEPSAEPGSGFHNVVRAIGHLTAAGFYPPYVTVTGPTEYARWHRLYGNSGVLEREQIEKLTTAGVLVSPLIGAGTVLVAAVGAENVDLAVGLDLTTAFLETAQMNHHFRVLEVVAPRIKRPESIVVLQHEPS